MDWSWIHQGGLVLVGTVLLHIGVSLNILLTKRTQPSEALFWLLLVVLFPFGGIIFYLLFGIVRLKHAQKKVLQLQTRMKEDPGKYFGPALAALQQSLKGFVPPEAIRQKPHNRMLDRVFSDYPAYDGNHVEMLHDGVTAYPRMLEDIAKAQHCIRMQSFILMSDKVGRAFMDALEERARAGVDVKVIFDSFGSLKSYFSHYFRRLLRRKQANFKIRAFSPFHLVAPWLFQLRNHRKLLLIDGRIAYTGGINISDENERLTSVPTNRRIHDLHARIEGPAVSQFAESFFIDWSYTTRCKWIEGVGPYDFPLPERKGDSVVRVLASGPGCNYEGTRRLFFAAAMSAQKSLWIMTPYFVPGPEFINLLCLTAARGVDVRIIVPANNNHFFVSWAAQNFYSTLLEAGVGIYNKHGLFSHIKALVVDGRSWGFMGSSNCDSRSFRLNFELDFCFEEGAFPERMFRQFLGEMANSTPVTLDEVQKKSLGHQLGENICALFTPIL